MPELGFEKRITIGKGIWALKPSKWNQRKR